MAERTHVTACLLYTVLMMSCIYPIIAHCTYILCLVWCSIVWLCSVVCVYAVA